MIYWLRSESVKSVQGRASNTQGWGGQGNEFQSQEEFQGEALGDQARSGEERDQSGDARMHRPIWGILRPVCLDESEL